MATKMKPRLNHTARMALFGFFDESNWSKYYITSKTFLNSLFSFKNKGDSLPHISIYFDFRTLQFQTGWKQSYRCFGLMNIRVATAVLKLCHLEAIELNLVSEGLERQFFELVMGLARVLKIKPELKSIHLFAHNSTVAFILDVLPKNTLKELELDSFRIPIDKFVSGRLDRLIVRGRSDELDYVQIFKCPTQRIEIAGWDVDLLQLQTQSPFSPNPHLESIQIPVFLELVPLAMVFGEWREFILPKYEKIFNDLKAINNEIKLEVAKHTANYLVYEYWNDAAPNLHHRLLNNIKLFIDLAQECQVQIAFTKYSVLIANSTPDPESDTDFYTQNEKFASQTGLSTKGFEVFGDYVHNGVAFRLVYDFWNVLG